MRRRISWLVLATTSTIVVSFVVPLCLLVRTLAEDRAMASADQEAGNVAALVAGRLDAANLTAFVETRNGSGDVRSPSTPRTARSSATTRRPAPTARYAGRWAAKASRWSTTAAAGCCSPW